MAKEKLHDKWFRFIGIPVIAFMGHIIFYNRNEAGEQRYGFWIIYLLSLAETMLLWEVNRLVFLYYRNRFPALQQTRQRIIYVFFASMIVTIILRGLNVYVFDKTKFWGYEFPLEAYLQAIAVAMLFVVVVGGVYEATYYFRKWKDMAVEAEALKKENLQTQFDSLKMQINPHFLFNSLGSLSSLIEENPKEARTFVNEMASVYRYLLQSNEKGLVTLQEEIEFIEAYTGMLTKRFPEGLQVSININDEDRQKMLPPLTLQLLLENAVKHNAVLASKPLHVQINSEGRNILKVCNNLQPKTSPVQSNRMGLHNIITKYKLLNKPGVSITKTDESFCILLPLINNGHL
ncbi:MAG: sensor histidine kinase [Flavisolibacter sp.]